MNYLKGTDSYAVQNAYVDLQSFAREVLKHAENIKDIKPGSYLNVEKKVHICLAAKFMEENMSFYKGYYEKMKLLLWEEGT